MKSTLWIQSLVTLAICTPLVHSYQTSQTGIARLNRIRDTLSQITNKVRNQGQKAVENNSIYHGQEPGQNSIYQATTPLANHPKSSPIQTNSSNPFYEAPVTNSHDPVSHNQYSMRPNHPQQINSGPVQNSMQSPNHEPIHHRQETQQATARQDQTQEGSKIEMNAKIIERLDKCQSVTPYMDVEGEKGTKARSLYEKFCFDLIEDLALSHNLDSFYAPQGKFHARQGRHVDANRYFTKLYQLFPNQLDSNLLYIRNLSDLGQGQMANEMLSFVQSQFASKSLSVQDHAKIQELAKFVEQTAVSP